MNKEKGFSVASGGLGREIGRRASGLKTGMRHELLNKKEKVRESTVGLGNVLLAVEEQKGFDASH